MATDKAQEFLFQRIKELLPPHVSLVDAVAEILHVSNDSAYRRIRGDTAIVLDEVKLLTQHYHISLDQLLRIQNGSTLFETVRIDLARYSYEKYLQDLIKQVDYIGSFIQKEVIYLTKDVPLFHNFYYAPLTAFRYFFWMKTIIEDPAYKNQVFDAKCLSPEIEGLSRQLTMAYNRIPSTEIWNTECINAAISQVEFYKDSGYFSSISDVKLIYESLEATIEHLKAEVECGCKYMPGENPASKKNHFRFFFNRVVLGDNTILVVTDNVKSVYLNYDVLNYMYTRDPAFTEPCYRDIHNLMKRATLISQTSEKHRNIFFGILLEKINDRKKKL